MSAKEKKLAIIITAILAVVVVLAYCTRPAKAAEMKGELFLPLSVRYLEDFGVAGGLGYRFPSGLLLSGQISYDHLDAKSVTSSCQIRCQECSTTGTVPAYGKTGFEFTVGIPLGKKK